MRLNHGGVITGVAVKRRAECPEQRVELFKSSKWNLIVDAEEALAKVYTAACVGPPRVELQSLQILSCYTKLQFSESYRLYEKKKCIFTEQARGTRTWKTFLVSRRLVWVFRSVVYVLLEPSGLTRARLNVPQAEVGISPNKRRYCRDADVWSPLR